MRVSTTRLLSDGRVQTFIRRRDGLHPARGHWRTVATLKERQLFYWFERRTAAPPVAAVSTSR